jgi:hypothetical protein
VGQDGSLRGDHNGRRPALHLAADLRLRVRDIPRSDPDARAARYARTPLMAYDEDLAKRLREALARPHVALMEMRGRTMDGWITVAPEGLKTKRDISAWVRRSLAFVRTLPPK